MDGLSTILGSITQALALELFKQVKGERGGEEERGKTVSQRRDLNETQSVYIVSAQGGEVH